MIEIQKNTSLRNIYERLADNNNEWCNSHCHHLIVAAEKYKAAGGEGDPITEVFDDVFNEHCDGCPVSDFMILMSSGCDAAMGRGLKNLLNAVGWEED